jgi:molybdopterin-guanine dinucleotide biosynthesis protein A
MEASGFVLAGGKSSRMGRDKAALPYGGTTLANYVASLVREAAGTVAILGDPERYGALGYPVYPDLIAGCGPLGGVYTGLSVTSSDWSLLVACDMPSLTSAILRTLLDRAASSVTASSATDCVAASGSDGEPEPLCAAYHRRCLPVVKQAIEDKRLKMKDLLGELRTEVVSFASLALVNLNTPAEWREFSEKPE